MLYVCSLLFYELPLLLSYERDVGARGEGRTAKDLSLSAALVGTAV